MNTILTPDKVNEIFLNAMQEKENENTIKCNGIMGTYPLDKVTLEKNKETIMEMLMELPLEFRENSGGGYSFLGACNDKNGNQWTGLHMVMERLFILGIGIGKVKELFPRELRSALPGGMPYYVILTNN